MQTNQAAAHETESKNTTTFEQSHLPSQLPCSEPENRIGSLNTKDEELTNKQLSLSSGRLHPIIPDSSPMGKALTFSNFVGRVSVIAFSRKDGGNFSGCLNSSVVTNAIRDLYDSDITFDESLSTDTVWVYHCSDKLCESIDVGESIKVKRVELCRVEFQAPELLPINVIYFQPRNINVSFIDLNLTSDQIVRVVKTAHEVAITHLQDQSIDYVWAFACPLSLLDEIKVGDEIIVRKQKLIRVDNASTAPPPTMIHLESVTGSFPEHLTCNDLLEYFKESHGEDVMYNSKYSNQSSWAFECTESILRDIQVGECVFLKRVKLRRTEGSLVANCDSPQDVIPQSRTLPLPPSASTVTSSQYVGK